jgi:putative flippase GtrA
MASNLKLRYLIAGSLGAILEMLLFSTIYKFSGSVIVSNLIAFQVAITLTFLMHQRFTYIAIVDSNGKKRRYALYLLLMYLLLIFGTFILEFFIDNLFWNPDLSKLVQMLIAIPISYFVQKKYIFVDSKFN